MKFLSVDFETANSNRSSACSIGLALVVNGQIIDTYYELIKPEPFLFDPINMSIHGITETDVQDKASFRELYFKKFESLFKDNIVVCHNAAFDMSVLRHSLGRELEKIDYEISYACSLVISKMLIHENANYKLPTLCNHFGISLSNHHNALDDAIACANLTLKLAETQKPTHLEDFINYLECQTGIIDRYGYQPFSSTYSSFNRKEKKYRSKSNVNRSWLTSFELGDYLNIGIDLFENKRIVISGVFGHFKREDLKTYFISIGALCQSSINSKTDFLVAGDKMGPSKLEKAIKLGTTIISEDEFLTMIGH